jgi:hypothetical protein
MVVSEQLDAQQAHAILHALRLIFDSMKLTEQFASEYRLTELAEEMRRTREDYQALYQRLVDLGVAPAVDGGN